MTAIFDRPGEGRLAHAPKDHPPQPRRKIGVLVANLGTPDNYDYWSMRRYLGEFLSDKRVIDFPAWKWQPLLQLVILSKRPFTSGANYKSIWNHEAGESPLMTITKAQVAKLRTAIEDRHGADVMVEFCMRYGNPSTESVLRKMVAAGCERLLFLPLYPQYAGATSATANDQLFRALMKEKRQPAVRVAPEYFDHPLYVEALAQHTGGDAPIALFMGDLPEPGRPATKRLEDYLPTSSVEPAPSADLTVLSLLETGRTLRSGFDLKTSPLAAVLYRQLGDEGVQAHLETAKSMDDAKAWLDSLPEALVGAVAKASAEVAVSRRAGLLALA